MSIQHLCNNCTTFHKNTRIFLLQQATANVF